jgi:hypothetical protein
MGLRECLWSRVEVEWESIAMNNKKSSFQVGLNISIIFFQEEFAWKQIFSAGTS